jgi:hypothetical protein
MHRKKPGMVAHACMEGRKKGRDGVLKQIKQCFLFQLFILYRAWSSLIILVDFLLFIYIVGILTIASLGYL